MKFLTFTDLHEDNVVIKELVKRISKPDIDFVICCGDISNFGSGLKYNLKKLNSIGKKIYIIPGNHEENSVLDNALVGFSNCINFDCQAVELGNYILLGYGSNGFSQEDAEFRKISRNWYGKYNGKKIIFVTHGPAFGSKLDLLDKHHVGNKDYRNFIERIKPKLVISGHLHETIGVMDKINDVKYVNPGWEGMVVELN
ncbi:MAG: metallophosphoesterase [Nanoarchaeota archaeon]|nr:metallophosphoesterase [Nanoarchaeota archaeon]MBU1632302.1 metallophosphoesterase [Nanoarchaeota archaeon]MBU1875747.1 metallophosphoesterase [Nanoarchaeota archaeon]